MYRGMREFKEEGANHEGYTQAFEDPQQILVLHSPRGDEFSLLEKQILVEYRNRIFLLLFVVR